MIWGYNDEGFNFVNISLIKSCWPCEIYWCGAEVIVCPTEERNMFFWKQCDTVRVYMLCHFERLDSTKQWSFFFCLLKGRKESPQNKRPLSQTFFSKGVDKLNTLWKSCNWGKNSPLLTKRSHFLSFQVSLKKFVTISRFSKKELSTEWKVSLV